MLRYYSPNFFSLHSPPPNRWNLHFLLAHQQSALASAPRHQTAPGAQLNVSVSGRSGLRKILHRVPSLCHQCSGDSSWRVSTNLLLGKRWLGSSSVSTSAAVSLLGAQTPMIRTFTPLCLQTATNGASLFVPSSSWSRRPTCTSRRTWAFRSFKWV